MRILRKRCSGSKGMKSPDALDSLDAPSQNPFSVSKWTKKSDLLLPLLSLEKI